MSEARSPVHPVRPAAFRPMDFLGLARPAGGFSAQDFRSQVEPGFRRGRIEAMPDNRLEAPARWRPGPLSGEAVDSPSSGGLPSPAAPETAGSSPIDAAQAEQIRQAAFEEGLAQGLREGQARAEAQLREQQATEGEQQAQAVQALLGRIGDAVLQLRDEPDTLHEPLKRLALHLAEELVLGELQIGAQAIDRLVERCVDELQASQQADVCIELNPDDLQRLQAQPDLESDRPQPWRWEANDSLLPGSVRVRVDDAMVTDLVEHRLQSLAASLLGQPQRWSAQTALRGDRISARFGQVAPVSDVQPRPAPEPAPEPASEPAPEQDDTHE